METDKTLHDRAYALVTNSEQDSGSDKPFLEVDAEHRYKTREEAADAITESSRRVDELSTLEERFRAYGLERPEDFDNVVDEYLTRLEERQRSEKAAPLSEQDQANLKYLESIGVLTRDHFQAAAQKQDAAEAQARDEATIESALNDLRTLLTDAGLKAEDSKFAEPWMKEWIESQSVDSRGRIKPGSLLDRFWNGGESAKKVIQEAFAVWHRGTEGIRRGAASQPTAKSPSGTTRGQNPGGIPSELHDRAFALLQSTPPKRRGIR